MTDIRTSVTRSRAALVTVVTVAIVASALVIMPRAIAQTPAPVNPTIRLVKVDSSLPDGRQEVKALSPVSFGSSPVYEFQVWATIRDAKGVESIAPYTADEVCVSWTLSAVTPAGLIQVDQDSCSRLAANNKNGARMNADWSKLPPGTTSVQVGVQLYHKGPSDQPDVRYPAPAEFATSAPATGFPPAATTTKAAATTTTTAAATTTTTGPAAPTTTSIVTTTSIAAPVSGSPFTPGQNVSIRFCFSNALIKSQPSLAKIEQATYPVTVGAFRTNDNHQAFRVAGYAAGAVSIDGHWSGSSYNVDRWWVGSDPNTKAKSRGGQTTLVANLEKATMQGRWTTVKGSFGGWYFSTGTPRRCRTALGCATTPSVVLVAFRSSALLSGAFTQGSGDGCEQDTTPPSASGTGWYWMTFVAPRGQFNVFQTACDAKAPTCKYRVAVGLKYQSNGRLQLVGPTGVGTIQMHLDDLGACSWNLNASRGTCTLATSGGSWTDQDTGYSAGFQLQRMSASEARATKAQLGNRDDFDAPDQV